MSSEETMQQLIWNNCNCHNKGNKPFFKNEVTCGVLHIKQYVFVEDIHVKALALTIKKLLAKFKF